MSCLLLAGGMAVSGACGFLVQERQAPLSDPSAIVGPFTMEVEISDSTKIYSFADSPSPEREPEIRRQLVSEVTLHAQRLFAEHLAKQPGFTVVPLQDARRLEADLSLSNATAAMPVDSLIALGRAAGVDVVLFGRIIGYGQLPMRYWLTGWAVTASTQLTIVGVASGGNPVVMAGYLGIDLLTDLPIWTGGFYAFGWAFRPVFVEVEAWQLTGCEQRIWSARALALTNHKALEAYPEAERAKKQVQLEVNLTRVMEELAQGAGESLRVKLCPADSPTSGPDRDTETGEHT